MVYCTACGQVAGEGTPACAVCGATLIGIIESEELQREAAGNRNGAQIANAPKPENWKVPDAHDQQVSQNAQRSAAEHRARRMHMSANLKDLMRKT